MGAYWEHGGCLCDGNPVGACVEEAWWVLTMVFVWKYLLSLCALPLPMCFPLQPSERPVAYGMALEACAVPSAPFGG